MFQITKSGSEWQVSRKDGKSFPVSWSDAPALSVNFETLDDAQAYVDRY